MERRDGILCASGEESGTVGSSSALKLEEPVLLNDLDLSWKVSISTIFGLLSRPWLSSDPVGLHLASLTLNLSWAKERARGEHRIRGWWSSIER